MKVKQIFYTLKQQINWPLEQTKYFEGKVLLIFHVIWQKIWRDVIIRMTKPFKWPGLFNEWVTKSFEQFDVSSERVAKSFEQGWCLQWIGEKAAWTGWCF